MVGDEEFICNIYIMRDVTMCVGSLRVLCGHLAPLKSGKSSKTFGGEQDKFGCLMVFHCFTMTNLCMKDVLEDQLMLMLWRQMKDRWN